MFFVLVFLPKRSHFHAFLPSEFLFKVSVPSGVTPKGSCVFWRPRGESAVWQTSGCRLVADESDDKMTTCECDHLTIFASIMDPFGSSVSEFGTHFFTAIPDFGLCGETRWPSG